MRFNMEQKGQIRDALRQRIVKAVEFTSDSGEIRMVRLRLDNNSVVEIAATSYQSLAFSEV